jgi:hypothetical protein
MNRSKPRGSICVSAIEALREGRRWLRKGRQVVQITCETIGVWQWIAAGFAILSAGLWTAASLFKVPPPPISYETIDEIAAALKKQGRFNAGAALSAAVAAVIQSALIVAPTCIHLS